MIWIIYVCGYFIFYFGSGLVTTKVTIELRERTKLKWTVIRHFSNNPTLGRMNSRAHMTRWLCISASLMSDAKANSFRWLHRSKSKELRSGVRRSHGTCPHLSIHFCHIANSVTKTTPSFMNHDFGFFSNSDKKPTSSLNNY